MIAIIRYADDAEIAEFIEDETGKRKIFKNWQDADSWLEGHAEVGVAYRFFDDED